MKQCLPLKWKHTQQHLVISKLCTYTLRKVEMVSIIGKGLIPSHTHTLKLLPVEYRILLHPFMTHLELCHINSCHYDVVIILSLALTHLPGRPHSHAQTSLSNLQAPQSLPTRRRFAPSWTSSTKSSNS